MKARHVIGIIILIPVVLSLGPMVLASGIRVEEIPQHQARWWFGALLFGVPAAVLILIGALVVGPGHRVQAAAWTLLAGAVYGGLLLLTMAPFMASPEFGEMMANMQAQQGQRPATLSLLIERPLYLTALLALMGAGGLYLHHVVLKQPSIDGELSVESTPVPPDGSRPLSVTILSWFLIVTSVVGLSGYLFSLDFVEVGMSASVDAFGGPSVATQKRWMIATMLLTALSGIFILRGANWARWTLVITAFIGLALNALIYRHWWTVAPALFWLAIYGYFLFYRAPAVAWFTRRREADVLKA